MVSGKGPIFNDCRGASDEELEYMIHWLLNEGNKGLLDHMAEEGIDLRKHAVEFRTYEIGVRGGVRFNVNAETSLEGLYAAGDECGGGIAFASIWGRVAGERAAEFAKKADQGDPSNEKDRIDEKLALIEDIRSRKDGPTWQEANIALQQIMWEYAGLIRSESLLDQGLRNLGRLKERVSRSIKARNGHELGRCLEVMNLLDVGEVVMFAAGIRKETRGAHRRTDYPFTNPMMDKALVIRKEGEKPLFCWMEKSE
jgi:succinate dehydrogenase/fumarate reductase flavoprotein subunit